MQIHTQVTRDDRQRHLQVKGHPGLPAATRIQEGGLEQVPPELREAPSSCSHLLSPPEMGEERLVLPEPPVCRTQ